MDKLLHYDNLVFDAERALYGLTDVELHDCKFAGPADGESALKQCVSVTAENCFFGLRYPLWHCDGAILKDCQMNVNARAAIWYSRHVYAENCVLDGIKVFRECTNFKIVNCKISSFESCWSCDGITIDKSSILSEYFMLGSKNFKITNSKIDGKYPFQYVSGGEVENCTISFKDAFWHAKDVTVRNSVLKGEYLGWYSQNLKLINCVIEGTQPLCYCKGLKLINCRMVNCDLAFELSEVEADIQGRILSVRSPLSGEIVCDGVDSLVEDVTVRPCRGKVTVRKS